MKRKMKTKPGEPRGMICDLRDVRQIVRDEGLDVCVVSYGGSCSNRLVDVLEENHYTCRTPTWRKILCHCPCYIDMGIPVIYLYDHPVKSFLSMKRRWKGRANQRKLNNDKRVKCSDENHLASMIRQFDSFTRHADQEGVLILRSAELFDDGIVVKLRTFLGNERLEGFPVPYRAPRTVLEGRKFSRAEAGLFLRYQAEIDRINRFRAG